MESKYVPVYSITTFDSPDSDLISSDAGKVIVIMNNIQR